MCEYPLDPLGSKACISMAPKIWLYTGQYPQWSARHLVQPPRLWVSLSAPGWVLSEMFKSALPGIEAMANQWNQGPFSAFWSSVLRASPKARAWFRWCLMCHGCEHDLCQNVNSFHDPVAAAYLERRLWNVLGYHSNDMLMRQVQ